MKTLTTQHIIDTAKSIGVEPAALKAVAIVESAGDGYLPDGRCKILFEGHIFWRQLVIKGINPKIYASKNPDILFKDRDKTKYKGGPAEYNRLAVASVIHKEAALRSASWGMFQIMGFNCKQAGYVDVFEFTEAMQQSAEYQLRAVASFIANAGMLDSLRAKNWKEFARRYNGPAYAENKYDIKLDKAYNASLTINNL